MRRLLALVALAAAAPLAAQDEQPPAVSDSARRARLEQRIEQVFQERVRQDLRLTEDQVSKLRATHERFAPQRRELMQRQRQLRQALDAQMQPGIAADADSVRKLKEAMTQNRSRMFELEQQQERELGAYLSPVQVARYRMMREHLRQRIDDVRRNWGRDPSGPRGRPGMQRARPRARPR